MKQSPEMDRIQGKMRPGQLTAHGFLGEDDRNIADIIRDDKKAVEQNGINSDKVAQRMLYFTQIASAAFGSSLMIDEDYIVTVDEHRGIMPCPFGDGYKADKRNTRFENTKLGITIYWSDLNIHMIKEHGFYEGKGSFFRVDSENIARILGMTDET